MDTKIEQQEAASIPALISRTELKEQLKNRTVKPNKLGFISASIIIGICEDITCPRSAKKFFEECREEGLLHGRLNGNSGTVYEYPHSVPGQLSIINGGRS